MLIPPPDDFTLTYLRKEQVARDAYSFYFKKPKGFHFLAGQYVRMILPLENPDHRGKSRLFTIASSPNKAEIMITTRIVESTFKKSLFSLKEGVRVECFGPIGRFVLDESDTRPLVFLAGGIGVTPFHSIIQYAVEKQVTKPIYLFVSFPTNEDLVFYEDFQKLSKANPHIKVVFTVTRHDEVLHGVWGGPEGRISPEVIKGNVPDVTQCLFYICGPHVMLFDMMEMVVEMGVKPENIKKEDFVGY